jgi:hypothetical protein
MSDQVSNLQRSKIRRTDATRTLACAGVLPRARSEARNSSTNVERDPDAATYLESITPILASRSRIAVGISSMKRARSGSRPPPESLAPSNRLTLRPISRVAPASARAGMRWRLPFNRNSR